MSKILLLTFILGAFISSQALAFPLPLKGFKPVQIPASFTPNYDFEGIVALNDCSGSLIQLENAKDTDFGLILTNGHCYEGGFSEPGQFIYGVSSGRDFGVMDSSGQTVGHLTATEVVYSTMTKTDITIYKLSDTYATIKSKYGVRPFTLSARHPTANEQIEVISGYWQRGYTCAIETFVNQLREDKWTFADSIRYSRPGCETIGGTSGSPIILDGSRTVIGVNNTGNEDGQKCTMNNPCEVDANGQITFHQGYDYGQETFLIYSCVNKNNELDLAVPGCLLPH